VLTHREWHHTHWTAGHPRGGHGDGRAGRRRQTGTSEQLGLEKRGRSDLHRRSLETTKTKKGWGAEKEKWEKTEQQGGKKKKEESEMELTLSRLTRVFYFFYFRFFKKNTADIRGPESDARHNHRL
jgi:hypothetical protein